MISVFNCWAEGPTAIKINGEWIVYFDKYTSHKYGAAASPDLIHWTDISDKVSFPQGVRHGTVLKISMAAIAYNLKKLLKWEEQKRKTAVIVLKKGREKPLFFIF